MTTTITPQELKAIIDSSPKEIFIVDVRDKSEYQIANIGGKLIPMSSLEQKISEIDFTKTVVVVCHHGVRSAMAADWLTAKGYKNVKSLTGGLDAWSKDIDPNLARY